MAAQVTLRPAKDEDEPFLRRLFERTRQAEFALLPLPEDQKRALVDMQFRAKRQQYRAAFPEASYWVLVVGGADVGVFTAQEDIDVIRAIDIAIMPEHQGRGIGTAVFQDLVDSAGRSGKPVILHVAQSNRARRLYERLGFVQTGGDGMYVEMTWTPSTEDQEPSALRP